MLNIRHAKKVGLTELTSTSTTFWNDIQFTSVFVEQEPPLPSEELVKDEFHGLGRNGACFHNAAPLQYHSELYVMHLEPEQLPLEEFPRNQFSR